MFYKLTVHEPKNCNNYLFFYWLKPKQPITKTLNKKAQHQILNCLTQNENTA